MSLFDGMAGLLNDVFGSPVTLFPTVGGLATIQAVFREEPINVLGEDGREVLVVAPTLRVPADVAGRLARGDRVEPEAGRRFRILNRIHTGSPAVDRFVIFQLEAEC